MSEREAFIRCILENPEDDVARLVFADWLQERDCSIGTNIDGWFDAWYGQFIKASILREPHSNGGFWFHRVLGDLFKPLEPYSFTLDDSGHVYYSAGNKSAPPSNKLHIERGFVSRIELPCAAFMQHAEAIFSQHPATDVKLTDKSSHRDGSTGKTGIGWRSSLEGSDWNLSAWGDYLPWNLWQLLDGYFYSNGWYKFYDTTADADAALSRDCVRYGRKLAKLPPLTLAKEESRE